MDALNRRLEDKQLSVILTPAAKDFIVEESYDPAFGARPLRRYVQHTVETLISRKILEDDVSPGTTMPIDDMRGELGVRCRQPELNIRAQTERRT